MPKAPMPMKATDWIVCIWIFPF